MANHSRKRGFTIVELLIVVVIIGILAAIVIVAYNGVTRSARDGSVKSDISNFEKKIKQWQVENGQYPSQVQMSASMGIKVNKNMYLAGANNNWYYCSNTARTRFAVGATAESSREGFVYDSETGLRTEAAVWGGTTCPGTLVTDPYYNSGPWAGCTWASGACTWAAWIDG